MVFAPSYLGGGVQEGILPPHDKSGRIIWVAAEEAGAVPVVWSGPGLRVHEYTPAGVAWVYQQVGQIGQGVSGWG